MAYGEVGHPRLAKALWIAFVLLATLCTADSRFDSRIEAAATYAQAGLYEEAKIRLVEIINESAGGPVEADARFTLGYVLFQENKTDLAIRQWSILASKFPDSEHAGLVAGFAQSLQRDILDEMTSQYDDILFLRYLESSRLFWEYEQPSVRFDFDDLRDPYRAYLYYEQLYGMFEESDKRAVIRYHQIMLVAGLNADDFGYLNANKITESDKEFWRYVSGDPWPGDKVEEPEEVEEQVERLDPRTSSSRRMRKHREDVEGGNLNDELRVLYLSQTEYLLEDMAELSSHPGYVAQAYFWVGLATSDKSFWSGKVKVTEISQRFYDRVIEYTRDEPNSVLRVFAAYWLTDR